MGYKTQAAVHGASFDSSSPFPLAGEPQTHAWLAAARSLSPTLTVGEGTAKRRLIYGSEATYDPEERRRLRELETYWRENGFEDPVERLGLKADPSLRLRYLGGSTYCVVKATKMLEEYVEWRLSGAVPVPYAEVAGVIASGAVYWHGRDEELRPILIVDCPVAGKQNPEHCARALLFLLEFALQDLLLKGKVEQWTVVLDLRGMWLTSLPYSFLAKIVPLLQTKYKARLWRLYMVGMPFMLSGAFEMVKGLCEPTTVSKFVSISDPMSADVWDTVPLSQLPARLGGSSPDPAHFGPPDLQQHPPLDSFFSDETLSSAYQVDNVPDRERSDFEFHDCSSAAGSSEGEEEPELLD